MAAVNFTRVEARHIDQVASHLRDADREEVQALVGDFDPHSVITDALSRSSDSWALQLADCSETLCIFGVSPNGPLVTPIASPWLLGTPLLARYPGVLVRNTRRYLAEVRELYPMLVNYVDTRNAASIKYLKAVGFTLDDPQVYGVENRPFHRFHMGLPE